MPLFKNTPEIMNKKTMGGGHLTKSKSNRQKSIQVEKYCEVSATYNNITVYTVKDQAKAIQAKIKSTKRKREGYTAQIEYR